MNHHPSNPDFFHSPKKQDPKGFIFCLVVFSPPISKNMLKSNWIIIFPKCFGMKISQKKIFELPPPTSTYSRSKSRGEGIRICFVGCWPETPPKTWVLAASVHETYGGLRPFGTTRRNATSGGLVAISEMDFF